MIAIDPDLGAAATSHKPHRAQPAVSSRDTEPVTTGAIAAKPPAASASANDDDETLPTPFHFPAASRRRMRECGEKWQAMKMSGTVGDEIWRAFATKCLAAANGPSEASSER